MNITFIPEKYRTKEQDVRIELIKGFLNKSNLDYEELQMLFNIIELTPSYSNYTINNDAYAQFKEQFFKSTSQEDVLNVYGSEFKEAGIPCGVILDKTYAEIKEIFEQGKKIILHLIPLGLNETVIDVSEDQYGYYVAYITDDNPDYPIKYYAENLNDYPYMHYGT